MIETRENIKETGEETKRKKQSFNKLKINRKVKRMSWRSRK